MHEHISGLAAPDARTPGLMTAGFLTLGACTVVFASELDRRLAVGPEGSGPGPALMGASGLALATAALFRRDRMSNEPPPDEESNRQSWRNDLHDAASVAGSVTATLSLLALARRFAGDPRWRGLAFPALVTTVSGSGLLAWFGRDVVRPGNGVVQRAAVSLPLGFMARLAWRMLGELKAPPTR